ncbi:hypothetical protein PIB30_034808 [Stylosanthes scabra]|uniref:Putative plant transposon protein domain-containing protein n=1 Tax=Stylosanthes scabra TaxID=79078 RepID=A0ABU6UCA2_9FABA|nr:hypothetical protein [Stylosanthes scabra]
MERIENRDIVHERIVRIDGEEEPIFRNRIQGLGWGFMYEDLVRINVSVVREFCANFSSANQEHVFLRGKRIPFTETNIRRHLGILDDAPDADVDDAFVALAKSYEKGEDMDMAAIYAEIGREETNLADNSAVNLIPKTINNLILNPRATAWHKNMMANIDAKTHGTKFDMRHALLIFVLMTEGEVNLPRIMRDILPVRPTKHPRHLLPFPVFITQLANRYEVPEFPNDKFHTIWPVDMYVPYGHWRGKRARGPARPRRQPHPQEQQEEQPPPPEPEQRPSTSATPFAPAKYSLEPTMHDIMRRFDRQDRQIARTQNMIRQASPHADFTGLGFSSSSSYDGESQGF